MLAPRHSLRTDGDVAEIIPGIRVQRLITNRDITRGRVLVPKPMPTTFAGSRRIKCRWCCQPPIKDIIRAGRERHARDTRNRWRHCWSQS